MSDTIVTLFKKIDSEIVKAMIYSRDKNRMMTERWVHTFAEAETVEKTEPVKRQRKSKGAKDGDDSGATD